MILLDVSEDWREYMIYLEEEFSRLVSDTKSIMEFVNNVD